MIRTTFRILVIGPEEEEAVLMAALLSSIKAPVETEVAGPFNPLVMRNTCDCLIVDSRVYADPKYSGDLMRLVGTDNSRPTSVIHYGANLDDPVVAAQIRSIPGFITPHNIDRRKDTWLQALLRKVEEHCWSAELDELFQLLQGKRAHPFLPESAGLSYSSAFLSYGSLVGSLIGTMDPGSNGSLWAGRVYGVLPEANRTTVPLIISSLTQPKKHANHSPAHLYLPNLVTKRWSDGPEKLSMPGILSFSARAEIFARVLDRSLRKIKEFLDIDFELLETWLVSTEGDFLRLPFLHPINKVALVLSNGLTQGNADYMAIYFALACLKPAKTISWAWFPESVALWWAFRDVYPNEQIRAGDSITEWPNCSTGIWFIRFLEERYGSVCLKTLLKSDCADFWTALSTATEASHTALVTEFFRWTLAISALVPKHTHCFVLNHCSAVAFAPDASQVGLSIAHEPSGNLLLCLLSIDFRVIASVPLNGKRSKFNLPVSCRFLLLINLGKRSRDMNLLHDDGVTVEVVWAKAERMGHNQP